MIVGTDLTLTILRSTGKSNMSVLYGVMNERISSGSREDTFKSRVSHYHRETRFAVTTAGPDNSPEYQFGMDFV